MKVLLTGATGFLGNNLLRGLLNDGHEVTVFARPSSDFRPIDGLDVEIIYVDLADSSQIGLAVTGVDLLIHSAAMIEQASIRFRAYSLHRSVLCSGQQIMQLSRNIAR